jgi:hypothetical protein
VPGRPKIGRSVGSFNTGQLYIGSASDLAGERVAGRGQDARVQAFSFQLSVSETENWEL